MYFFIDLYGNFLDRTSEEENPLVNTVKEVIMQQKAFNDEPGISNGEGKERTNVFEKLYCFKGLFRGIKFIYAL